MKKLKVMTVLGTRPEIIRLSRVLAELEEHCEHLLVHTGQNYDYELNQIFFEDLGVKKPDYFLNSAGKSGAQTIGNVIIAVDELLETETPDALLVLGDTNSCLAVIAAKRRKIPTFHMEAGNRCFDMRVPEEINRKIVDHVADVNLTYSAIAREYLIGEGLPADLVIKTGSPMREVLEYYKPAINSSDVLERLGLAEDKFFIVSVHREENIDSPVNFSKIADILNSIASVYKIPIIVSTHPRTRKRLASSEIHFDDKINFVKPLSFTDYNKLQTAARAVISDSGTISEESSILNFPALNLRETHERPEAMEESAVMMVGLRTDRVLQALGILASQCRGGHRTLSLPGDYAAMNVSHKVVRVIHSYCDYVRRTVWKQY